MAAFLKVSKFDLFSQKNTFVFLDQILTFTWMIRFKLLADCKTSLLVTPIKMKSFQKVSKIAMFSHKNGFVFADQFKHF